LCKARHSRAFFLTPLVVAALVAAFTKTWMAGETAAMTAAGPSR
jgi:hypothetical protein